MQLESLMETIAAATSPRRLLQHPRTHRDHSVKSTDSDARHSILLHENVLAELEEQILGIGSEIFEEVDNLRVQRPQSLPFHDSRPQSHELETLNLKLQREIEHRLSLQSRRSEAELAEAVILREERDQVAQELAEVKLAKGKISVCFLNSVLSSFLSRL